MFITIRIGADNIQNAYTARRCLKLVVESIESSNHIAKEIFTYIFVKGDIQRMNPDTLDILISLFGFTSRVVLDPRMVRIRSRI